LNDAQAIADGRHPFLVARTRVDLQIYHRGMGMSPEAGIDEIGRNRFLRVVILGLAGKVELKKRYQTREAMSSGNHLNEWEDYMAEVDRDNNCPQLGQGGTAHIASSGAI
jgi:hypothetical protein